MQIGIKNKLLISLGLIFTIPLFSGCGASRQGAFNMDEKDLVSASTSEAAATALTAGDTLWNERGDEMKLTEGLAKWEAAAAASPNHEVFTKLARGYYFLADTHYALESKKELKDVTYEKALSAAEKALAAASTGYRDARKAGTSHEDALKFVEKDGVAALYWWSSALGKWAATKGFTTRLKYKDTLKKTMERISELDPSYFYGGFHRFMGAFETKTAGLAGGSLEKAKEHFEQSVAIAPNYLGTKVLWADYYATKTNDKDLFVRLLNEVIAADASAVPELTPENISEQAKAKALLEEVDDRF